VAEVPEGTIDDVLEWVGDDSGRAREAYLAEVEGKGRSTLLTRLDAIANETSEAEPEDETEPEAEPEDEPADDGPQYATTKRIRYRGKWYEPGEVLPGAGKWPRIESWVRTGYVKLVS
jgi:hypothetical protein